MKSVVLMIDFAELFCILDVCLSIHLSDRGSLGLGRDGTLEES